MRDPLNGYGLTILVFLESADPAFLSTCNFLLYSVCVFVTAASFLNITAITGIANLSEISYYEILANEHHHISP